MTSDEMPECPLCMVELFYDDLGFYPCSCGYQICRFCWSKILNEENGLCPACRRPYDSEAPASFTPMSEEQLQKLKREKRQKERKNKTIENRKHLADIRVVQRNLAFVIGLPQRFADHPETLKSQEYFGKYGRVFKVVVNRNAAQPGSQNQSTVGAYVTFVKGEDTLQAIMDLNKQQMEGRTLKASLGTTKYCSQFLKGQGCTKSECMYLHELGEQAASFTKEEMQQNKHTEYERKLIEDFIEQSGGSSESRLTSSSSHQNQSQNQSQNRHQHTSECKDNSSSSSNSNSNTPPSSRRQTKSESHTQSHRQSQQSHHGKHHHSNHRSGGNNGGGASSCGDGHNANSTAAVSHSPSQRTPRKNNQKSQGCHARQQQKQQQKRQNHQHHHYQQQHPAQSGQQQHQQQQQTPQQQQQQPQQAQQSQPQSQHAQPSDTQNQKKSSTPAPTAAFTASPSSETASCAPVGDPIPDTAPSNQSEVKLPTATAISPVPQSMMIGLNHQASHHPMLASSGPSLADDDQQTSGENVVPIAPGNGNIPPSSVANETGTSTAPLQPPTPSLLPTSFPLRQNAQVMNGLSGSSVGMSPYPLPMYSLQAAYLFEQRQHQFQLQQQQQQQPEDAHRQFSQSIMNSFDSQSLSATSFESEQTNQTEISKEAGKEHQYQLSPGHSLRWPSVEASSGIQGSSSNSNSLTDNMFSAHDDAANLDFDPVKESQQALAVLLEDERNNGPSNVATCGAPGYLSNNCGSQNQLTPPPGFELPSFVSPMRPSVLRPPVNLCHPSLMGYGYYSSGVPPGTMNMGAQSNESCACSTEASSMTASSGGDGSSHIPAVNSMAGQSSTPGPPSSALPFSMKALQDTLRCVLPEETNITFDASYMREMQQYQQHQQLHQSTTTAPSTQTNAGATSQISIDAIPSVTNSRAPLGHPVDSMANSSTKEPSSSVWPHNGFSLDDDPAVLASAPGVSNSLQPEYCSLWPQSPSKRHSPLN